MKIVKDKKTGAKEKEEKEQKRKKNSRERKKITDVKTINEQQNEKENMKLEIQIKENILLEDKK